MRLMPILYHGLVIVIPHNVHQLYHLRDLLDISYDTLRLVKSISLRTETDDEKHLVPISRRRKTQIRDIAGRRAISRPVPGITFAQVSRIDQAHLERDNESKRVARRGALV